MNHSDRDRVYYGAQVMQRIHSQKPRSKSTALWITVCVVVIAAVAFGMLAAL